MRLIKTIYSSILILLWISSISQTVTTESKGNICLINADLVLNAPTYSVVSANMLDIVSKDFGASGFANLVYVDTYEKKLKLAKNTNSASISQITNIVDLHYSADNYYGTPVATDLNNDGTVDIAYANAGQNIYTFKNPQASPYSFVIDSIIQAPVAGSSKSRLYSINYNNDNLPDLMIASTSTLTPYGFNYKVYQNTSSTGGALSFTPTSVTGSLAVTASLTMGEFDIAIGNVFGNGTDEFVFVSPEMGDKIGFGYSLFSSLNQYTLTSLNINNLTLKKVKLVDVNQDGGKEIAVLGDLFGVSFVYLCSPIITSSIVLGVSVQSVIPLSGDVSDIDFADMNRDTWIDLITTNQTSNVIQIYPKVKNSSLAFAQNPILFTPMGHTTQGLTIGDVDGNQKPDVISFSETSDYSIAMLKNYTCYDSLYAESGKYTICPGDSVMLVHDIYEYPGILLQGYTSSLFHPTIPQKIHKKAVFSPGTYSTTIQYFTQFSTPPSLTTCTALSNSIKIDPGIVPSMTVTGKRKVCDGDSTILYASGADSYHWSFNASNSNTVLVKPVAKMDFTVTGISIDGCKADFVDSLGVSPGFTPAIAADKNFLCIDESTKISATGGTLYLWNTGQTTPTITATQTVNTSQVYSVIVTNNDGCARTASIEIMSSQDCKELVVYKGITANSDGLNDYFYIENIDKYPNNKVTIFNRWGVEMFHREGYDNKRETWPMKENISGVMPGTYFYVIDPGDGEPILKGWVELFK